MPPAGRSRSESASRPLAGPVLLPPGSESAGKLARNPPPRCAERIQQRRAGAVQDALAVTAEDDLRRQSSECFTRRRQAKRRMNGEPLLAGPVVARGAERLGADQH